MKYFKNKKYRHHIPEEGKQINIGRENTEDDAFFVFSPLSAAESIHVGQRYQLFLQDSFRRFLEKKTMHTYSTGAIRSFSQNIYKALGNKVITIGKICKQKRQNNHKITQSYISLDEKYSSTLDEHTLLKAHKLFIALQNNISIQYTTVPWDTTLCMELQDQECLRDEKICKKYQIKFFVDGKGDAIVTFQKEPHTFFSTVAIAVHPKDRRYKKHLGRNVIVPIINKKIPIITDESINMIEDEGAKAINPGHDSYGLQIAQKHNLSITQYSIDEKGRFTPLCGRFSGKKVTEFKENVIRFLGDIGNLSIVGEQAQQIYTSIYNNIPIVLLNKKEYYLSLPKKETREDNGNINIDAYDILRAQDHILISSCAKVGGLLPVLYHGNQHYIFDEEGFVKSQSSVDKVFTLLIIHLVLEGRLTSAFTLEQSIEILFSPSYKCKEMKYESYLEYYPLYGLKEKDIHVVKKILDESSKNIDTFQLQELFAQSKYIIEHNNGNYELSRNIIIGKDENIELTLQNKLYFHQDFLSLPLYQEFFSTHKEILIVFDTMRQKELFSKFLSISGNTNIVNSVVFEPLRSSEDTIYRFNNSKIIHTQLQELQKQYGPDVVRMILLKSGGILSHIEDIEYISRLIQKIWNMCRFTFNQDSVDPNISDILTQNINTLNEFDLRMLDKTNETVDRILEYSKNNKYLEIMPILEEYILSYLDHYLEIQKHYESKYSKNIIAYCLIFLLQNIDIYLPLLCYQIAQQFNYTTITIKKVPVHIMEYKANIFNDIITNIQELKLRNNYMNHEHIDCIIQCGPDMSAFLAEHEHILKKIITIKDIHISEQKEDLPDHYIQSRIIDITLGIKKVESKQTKKQVYDALKKQISAIEDEIQRKKILLGRIIPLGDSNIIKKKKMRNGTT